MKKTIAFLSIFTLALALSAPVFANHEGGCPAGQHDCDGGSGCSNGGQQQGGCPITAKFMAKSAFFLDNKDALGLSDDQVKTIKALKLEVEKTSVRQGADMQIFMLDVMAKLQDDTVDVEGTNSLIDKGSAGMSESVKSVVAAYAKLKGTLTAEQATKAKAIWSKKS
jgi:hypothetical protein